MKKDAAKDIKIAFFRRHTRHSLSRSVYHTPQEGTSQSINWRNSSSVSTGIPNSWALRSLEPAASPATT